MLKWILIFIGFVIVQSFRAKGRAVTKDTEQESEGDLLGEVRERFEELSREFADRSTFQEPTTTEKKSKNSGKKATTSKPVKEPIVTEFNEAKEVVEEQNLGVNIAEEFDLRKAVIMSEILTRKYDE